jgi:hypothetical protein
MTYKKDLYAEIERFRVLNNNLIKKIEELQLENITLTSKYLTLNSNYDQLKSQIFSLAFGRFFESVRIYIFGGKQ